MAWKDTWSWAGQGPRVALAHPFSLSFGQPVAILARSSSFVVLCPSSVLAGLGIFCVVLRRRMLWATSVF